MKVSLVIPTYNRTEILRNTIEIARQQDYSDYEIIIIDQTPNNPDELQSYLDSLSGNIIYIKQENPSLTQARNHAIRLAKGEIIVFIDDDVIIPSNHLHNHASTYTDSDVGGVVGSIFPDTTTTFSDIALYIQDRYQATRLPLKGDILPIKWVEGCNCSFKREILLEVGLFDEYYQKSALCEDKDISARIEFQGYKLVLNTNAGLVHLAQNSGGCANRESPAELQKHLEHTKFRIYYNVKNREIVGLKEVFKCIWNGYRGIALNRPLIKKGIGTLLHHHVVFANCLYVAIRDGFTNSRNYPYPPTHLNSKSFPKSLTSKHATKF